MAHVYDVHTSDGRSYEVETPHHHDAHDEKKFAAHLLDVLKGATGSFISATVVRYVYRGHR